MSTIKIVETPIEDGQSKPQVRASLVKEYPDYKVAAIVKSGNVWKARLEKLHHRLAEFPLKSLGPEGEEEDSSEEPKDDMPLKKDEDCEDCGDEPKEKSEEKPKDEKPEAPKKDGPPKEKGEEKGADLQSVVSELERLLPKLKELVGEDEDMQAAKSPGPVDSVPKKPFGKPPGRGGPPGGLPGGPPSGGPVPGGLGAPVPPPPGGGPGVPSSKPAVPGGAGGIMPRKKPGAPAPGAGIFPTLSRTQILERPAVIKLANDKVMEVSEVVARGELKASGVLDDYEIKELRRVDDKWVAKLQLIEK